MGEADRGGGIDLGKQQEEGVMGQIKARAGMKVLAASEGRNHEIIC